MFNVRVVPWQYYEVIPTKLEGASCVDIHLSEDGLYAYHYMDWQILDGEIGAVCEYYQRRYMTGVRWEDIE